MGGSAASPRRGVGGVPAWTCVLPLLLLLSWSPGTGAQDLLQSSASGHVPLPLLLEALRHDILQEPVSRHTRHAAPDAAVPWYSAATRGGDDGLAQEELNVTSVVKRDKFNYGAGVKKWHSIASGSTTYLVGLGLKQITLITAKFVAPDVGTGQIYSLSETVHRLPSNPVAATVFKHWNAATKTMDVILVLSTENEGSLMWFRIKPDHVEAIRSWPVHKRVSHIRIFKIKEQMKLLMLTSCESGLELVHCEASADVFDFSFGNSFDARLSWSQKLETAAVSGEVGAVGDEVYLVLALPESNVARLYRYHVPIHSKAAEGSFQFWKDFSSPQVSDAVFFHVSYKMYLAVGGAKPALFRFVSPTRIEGCPRALQNLGFVTTWLVLPIQTYRDEVVVLAEVLHSDQSKALVTLTWSSAGVFNWQQYPCFIEGHLSPEGASCVLAETSELGLAGAVFVQLGDASVVSVLVPKISSHSALYDFQTQLQPNMNPLLSEIMILEEAKKKLNDELIWQTHEMQATERLLLDTVNPTGHNVIKADWVIQEVETEEYDASKQTPVWPAEPTVDVLELNGLMTELRKLTNRLSDMLSDAAVPVNGEVRLSGHQTLLGGLEVHGNTSFNSLSVGWLNGESVLSLMKDTVRNDQLGTHFVSGSKTFSDLHVTNVIFNMVNDVGKDDLVFNVPDKTARVHGVLEVTEIHVQDDIDLPPQGTVGGIDLSEQVFTPGKEFQGLLQFDEVTVEGDLTVNVINTVDMNPHNLKSLVNGSRDLETLHTLDVDGNLNVERINGFLWSDIVKSIVWRDLPDKIPETTELDGVLTADSINIEQLNGLNFPQDYVLKSIGSQQITATKKFSNLLVGSVDYAKIIDGVPVDALVTLNTNQHLNGELKLQEADISGDIKVNGAVNGIKLNQRQSPPLGPGVVVSSNVQFTNLVVAGSIVIVNTLDGEIFKNIVQDILVLPPALNEVVLLDGKKTVSALKVDNLVVSSGQVNNRKIAEIARIDYPLNFHGEKTIENAIFNDLMVTGKWDDVNVVNLNAEAVRLSGVQDIKSHLTFSGSSELIASRLVISDQLNKLGTSSVFSSKDMCEPSSTNSQACLIKGSVTTDIIKVSGNVKVDGKICGWKLIDFEKRRMSRSRPQRLFGKYSFGDISVSNHINVSQINGLSVHSMGRKTVLPPPLYEDLEKLLKEGGFAIDDLTIEGHIQTTNGVNSLKLPEIAQKAIKLNGGNMILGSLYFEDILNVRTLDVTGPVNHYNLAFEIQDAVLKDMPSVTIQGRKTFNAGFIVENMLKTNTLNGLVPSTIITKTTPATINGLLKVVGHVEAGNINLTGLLNNIPVTTYQNRYKLVSEGRHVLTGNAHFEGSVSVDQLSAMKTVQTLNLEDFFASVVMKSDPAHITGTKFFVNGVVFQNVDVRGRVNNLTLGEMVKDIVLHNDVDPVTINGHIVFEDTPTFSRGIHLTEDLDATELYGCSIKEWQDNAIYLSQGIQISGLKTFESVSSNSDLKLSFINAVDLSKIITLHTKQEIPARLNVIAAAVQHDLNVGGTVNGYHLQSEYDNTFMTEGNQIVTGSKTFLKGFTARNVLTKSLISGRNISNSVTLNNDETVNGPLKFSNMVIDQDLRVSGRISSLDVQNWNERALLKMAPVPQVITASYDVKGKVRCMQSISGDGLLDGESVLKLKELAYKKRDYTRKMQEEIKVEWTQMCHDTDALLGKARAQPFLFRQLEVVQSIVSSQPISSMHAFEALNAQFLAVSYSNGCSGAMYRWNRVKTAWELIDGAVQDIGSVEKWVTLRNAGSTYLVTSSATDKNCLAQAGNIWQIETDHRPRNVQGMDAWQDADFDENTGHIHFLRQSGVDKWLLKDGVATKVTSLPLAGTGAHSKFLPRSAGFGLSVSTGDNVTVLEKPEENLSNGMASRSSNPYMQGRNFGNLVTMKIADGRKLVVVTAEGSDLLVVYEDLFTAKPLAHVKVHGAHSLSVLELTAPGRNGQTLLAFIENERHLRVVEYKGVEGFVDVTRAKLPFAVKEMIPVRLDARAFVNQRHFLLLRSDHQVLLLEVEMSGDPLDEGSLNCNLP